MLNKFKYVWERMTSKVDGTLAMDTTDNWNDIEKARARLASLRFKNGRSTSTSNLDLDAVRKRINQESEESNAIQVRSSDSRALGKWFGKEDITESGSFDTTELHRRIDEVKRSKDEAKEMELESYPELEDTFLAFSKPEEDLFDDEERITLSGVHCKVDPMEDLDEEYMLPGLPMYSDDEDHVNELEIAESQQASQEPIDCSPEEVESEVKSPTQEILASLQTRMDENRRKDSFWVDSGV